MKKYYRDIWVYSVLSLSLGLIACDSNKNDVKDQPQPQQKQETPKIAEAEKADVLPYLNIQEQPAKIALPFCERKNCIDVDIQTLATVDPWINQWIAKHQSKVIQDQIDMKQDLTLQQAVNAYVKKSDQWQEQLLKLNKAYQLELYTRIPYQRNDYVLMQIGINSDQEGVKVKDRYYFFVSDRRQQKTLSLLDVIQPKQQSKMDEIVQQAYQKWLKDSDAAVSLKAPKKIHWGQADWFFDQQGIGVHYHGDKIVANAKQLDIFLSKEQTQQVLKAEIYQHMF
ncbi:hypothetical protein A3K93_01705 [Acinetobacter sp. NCu2D-2]|uniref:hypothetical protein n=1 Tax=Acinetobacter sp. NCu2D-2 TaxID=1608473 RepID=UPI0007CDEC6D|nr:hypothetical protein [Acinetobacter sp. NCu2D-2]ANF83066.1 hypothetical protein A3K93_01705 [Acinetobacter sp. NCu2D-2]